MGGEGFGLEAIPEEGDGLTYKTMERRLILHIGPGRTGTSALQTMLCRHVDHLDAHGIHFPRWPGFKAVAEGKVGSGNGGAIAALIARENRSAHYKPEDGLNALRQLYESPATAVLYSSEVMALFDESKLAFAVDLAASAGFVTKIVYYLREESAYANSAFARASATGSKNLPRELFLAKHTPPFGRHLRALRPIVGEENVIVRDYDYAKSDLFGDFCAHALGIPRPDGAMPWMNSSANQVPRVRPDKST